MKKTEINKEAGTGGGPAGAATAPAVRRAATAAPGGRRAAAGQLALLGTLTAIGPLSVDMYLPGLPAMTDELTATQSQVQLSLTTCMIGLALGQLVTGPLSDRWGRRRPVLLGVGAYALLTLACAAAPDAGTFAALRLLQGIAGGTGIVVARTIVRDLYTGTAAAKYFSRLTLIFGVAPVAAPSLGSLVLRFGSWRAIFVVLAVISALLTAAAAWRLPETLPPERRHAGGLRATSRAVRSLFGDRGYVGYSLAQALTFAGLFAYISGSSFVFEEIFDVPEVLFALIFGLNAAGLVTLGQLNVRLLDRWPVRRLLLAAQFTGLGAAALLLAGAALGQLAIVLVAVFAFVATVGMVPPNSTALALDRHAGNAGTAAAILGAVQSVIGSLAAPLVGLGDTGSAVPMAVVVLGAATLSLASVLTVARDGTRSHRPPAPG